ncbi:MAG: tRNA 2-thiouridine synthesizing protein A [Gammaproteobacteria bacterium]|jgi:tRNA 2-thiouridine synthesizing protein A
MKHAEIPNKHDHFLDAKGLNCPLPVLKAKLILNRIKPGEILYVQATDPHATIDFEAYCARTGHTISYSNIKDDVISLYIIRAKNLKII